MSDDRKSLKVIVVESFQSAMGLLDQVVKESGLRPDFCEKMVVKHSMESLADFAVFVVVQRGTTNPLPGSFAVAVAINNLAEDDVSAIEHMNAIGHSKSVDGEGTEGGESEDGGEQPLPTREEEIAELFERSDFIHTEDLSDEEKMGKKHCN